MSTSKIRAHGAKTPAPSNHAPLARRGLVPFALSVAVIAGATGGLTGCGTPRAMAVQGATYASDVADEAAPIIEEKCIIEMQDLEQDSAEAREAICDVAVPLNDSLALAIAALKDALRVESSDADLLSKLAEVTAIVAKFGVEMAKVAKMGMEQ